MAREVGINLLGSARRPRQPRQGEARRQGAGHGELRGGLRRPAQGDQRLLGSDGGGLRRERPACPLRRRHGASCPSGIPVEIEMILEVDPKPRSGKGPRREAAPQGERRPIEALSQPRSAHPRAEQIGQHVEGPRNPRAVPGQELSVHQVNAAVPHGGHLRIRREVLHVHLAEAIGLVGKQDHLRPGPGDGRPA